MGFLSDQQPPMVIFRSWNSPFGLRDVFYQFSFDGLQLQYWVGADVVEWWRTGVEWCRTGEYHMAPSHWLQRDSDVEIPYIYSNKAIDWIQFFRILWKREAKEKEYELPITEYTAETFSFGAVYSVAETKTLVKVIFNYLPYSKKTPKLTANIIKSSGVLLYASLEATDFTEVPYYIPFFRWIKMNSWHILHRAMHDKWRWELLEDESK